MMRRRRLRDARERILDLFIGPGIATAIAHFLERMRCLSFEWDCWSWTRNAGRRASPDGWSGVGPVKPSSAPTPDLALN